MLFADFLNNFCTQTCSAMFEIVKETEARGEGFESESSRLVWHISWVY